MTWLETIFQWAKSKFITIRPIGHRGHLHWKKTNKQTKKSEKEKKAEKEKILCIWATRDGESRVVNTRTAQRTASQDTEARRGEEE